MAYYVDSIHPLLLSDTVEAYNEELLTLTTKWEPSTPGLNSLLAGINDRSTLSWRQQTRHSFIVSMHN